MQYDLIIRDGMVVDGSGLPRYQADVGIVDGRVTKIGRINDSAKEIIDAEGHTVTPGFIDGAYAYGRPGFLGRAGHMLGVAWRHVGGDGQLRLFAGAMRRERQVARHAKSGTRRRYLARSDAGGNQMVVDDLPAISGRG